MFTICLWICKWNKHFASSKKRKVHNEAIAWWIATTSAKSLWSIQVIFQIFKELKDWKLQINSSTGISRNSQ